MSGTPAAPAIYVSDTASPLIRQAVVDGGGAPTTEMSQAQAIIWTGGDLDELATGLHAGIDWLQLPSAGVERYISRGLLDGPHVTTNAGPAFAQTVAEHTLALILACARHLHRLSRAISWSDPEIARLRGSTVAVLGCGRIGEALIDLLEPFDVEVLASTRSGRPIERATITVTPDRHHEILRRADFVVVAAPATDDTAQLIGPAELAVMRSTASLINISRGSLVDTDALVDALLAGSIVGAALDVTDPEPLPDGHPLWAIDQALITPHIANPDAWDGELLAPLIRSNVSRYVQGETLLALVDRARGY